MLSAILSKVCMFLNVKKANKQMEWKWNEMKIVYQSTMWLRVSSDTRGKEGKERSMILNMGCNNISNFLFSLIRNLTSVVLSFWPSIFWNDDLLDMNGANFKLICLIYSFARHTKKIFNSEIFLSMVLLSGYEENKIKCRNWIAELSISIRNRSRIILTGTGGLDSDAI